MLLMLQSQADTISAKCQMCYDSHHAVQRKGKKKSKLEALGKSTNSLLQGKIYMFQTEGKLK